MSSKPDQIDHREVITMLNRKFRIFLTIFMVVGTTLVSASTALAGTTGTPIPRTMTATSSVYLNTLTTKTLSVKSWIGVDEHIRIQKVPPAKCQHFGTFWNSNYLLGDTSRVPQMYIDHNGYLCRDKFSPTGWVKRGGGHTGLDCGNISAPMSAPRPRYKIVPPPSVELKHATNVLVKVQVNIHLTVVASVNLGGCSAGSSASYSDTETVRISYSSLMKAQTTSAKLNLFLSVIVTFAHKAQLNASATCTYTPAPTPTPTPTQPPPVQPPPTQPPPVQPPPVQPPPVQPPPVQHWTNVSCTGFEEISGGGSFPVDCAVSNDNGAPISLVAHSNDGNSRVSGINCYSQGGAPSCSGNGTYEFRVTGINDGSSIVSSSITVVASANGVSATFTSDPFPVDPSGGGF